MRKPAIDLSTLRFPGSKTGPGALFNAEWYIRNNNVTCTPKKAWHHFCDEGWRSYADPCAGFDTRWYLNAYPDVGRRNINPLLHYLEEGESQDFLLHPLFDTKGYRERNPDVALTGQNLLSHYLLNGIHEGRNPIDLFDDFWYLSTHKDVARSRTLPIYHYYKYGASEGRNPSNLFDTEFYKEHNTDITFKTLNPLYHYVKHGREEGRASKTAYSDTYLEWIRCYESVGPVARKSMRDTLKLFRRYPKFSIVVPVYNTPLKYLQEFINSVQRQTYPFWELCIADDASTSLHVRSELKKYKNDPRFKINYLWENMHIAGATNAAMAMASGDFICLMDHDDIICESALYEFALKLNLEPELDMIYSDEDKLSVDGQRYDPFFKPDWSPEYLEGAMYTAHFACYRKSVVDQIGGFRSECDGAQDYDFVLRFSQRTHKIGHIPKILYHWRAIPGSTAQSLVNKEYVISAAVRALSEYLGREGSGGSVKPGLHGGSFELLRHVKGEPTVSIVIPSAGHSASIRGVLTPLLVNCVRSIFNISTYKNIEIIVLHSEPLSGDAVESMRSLGVKTIDFTCGFEFAAMCNRGAEESTGEILLFLSDETEVISPGWLEAMIGLAQKPGLGCVGGKLIRESGEIQHVGITVVDCKPDHVLQGTPGDRPGHFVSNVCTRNWLAVTGACLMCAKKVFDEVDGFDSRFSASYVAADFCLRIVDRGLRCAFTPSALLYQFVNHSCKLTISIEEMDLFSQRWSNLKGGDPYYSAYFDARPPRFRVTVNDAISHYDGLELNTTETQIGNYQIVDNNNKKGY